MAPLGGSGQRLPGSLGSVVLAVPAQWFWQCQLSGSGSASSVVLAVPAQWPRQRLVQARSGRWPPLRKQVPPRLSLQRFQ